MIRPLEAFISTCLRGRMVNQPLRFVARELTGRHGVSTYTLRNSRVSLRLQHGTPDVLVLDEVFYQHLYDPPREVQQLLRTPLRAVDAGANIGLFGVWLLSRYPGSEILSFEPDRRNAALLAQTIGANRAEHAWRMVQAAVAPAAGTLGFAGEEFATSHVVDDPHAPTVTAVDFFAHAQDAQLVKIDIEGSEWEILADQRMAALPASAIVLEYHPERCPQRDTHAAAAQLLHAAGYRTKPIFKAATGVGMLWAWRPQEQPESGAT
jgi:FkbM family methyltransferase